MQDNQEKIFEKIVKEIMICLKSPAPNAAPSCSYSSRSYNSYNSYFWSHASYFSYSSFSSAGSFGAVKSAAHPNIMAAYILKYELYLKYMALKSCGYEKYEGRGGYGRFAGDLDNIARNGGLKTEDYVFEDENYTSANLSEGFFSLGYGLELI